MRMKFYYSFVMILVLIMGLTGCQGKLEKMTDEANAECPIAYNMVGLLSSITYEDGNVVFTFVTPDDKFDVKGYKAYPKLLKDIAEILPSRTVGKGKDILTSLSEDNKGLVMKFTGKPSGESVTIQLSPEELKKALAEKDQTPAIIIGTTPDSDPITALKNYLRESYKDLPEDRGQGLTLTSAEVNEKEVVFTANVDEAEMPISILKQHVAEQKQGIINNLNDISNASNVKLVKLCKDAGCGLQYKYIGKRTGNDVAIKIEPSELQ